MSSTFNLKVEFPDIDYNWYQEYNDGSPRCPANWTMINDVALTSRYFDFNGEFALTILVDEATSIPFKSGDLSNLTSNFTFKHVVNADFDTAYTIRVWFKDDYFIDLDFPARNIAYLHTITIPSNAEYVRIDGPSNYTAGSNPVSYVYTDVIFDVFTDDIEINTEQNNTAINFNNKSAISVDNTILTTKLKDREVFYGNELIMERAEELQMNAIATFVRLNKLLMSVNINITEAGGDTLANIGAGSLENIVKYWYSGHTTTQNSGLYSYVTLNYKYKKNSNVYI